MTSLWKKYVAITSESATSSFALTQKLLNEVKRNARFERAKFSSKSSQYTEEELLAKIKEYLTANNCITRRDLQQNFGLRQSAALKCLKHFTEIGILKKEGARNSPVYFLNK